MEVFFAPGARNGHEGGSPLPAPRRMPGMSGGALLERRRRTPVSELEFVGCEPAQVSAAEIESPRWEGRRVEYWHGETETAWMTREPASPCHEGAATRLAELVRQICLARGSDARCFGGMDLRIREDDGTLTDIMQADQTVILHPTRRKLPGRSHLIVGEHDLPDVVLEVDNTTDVRRGKLLAYEEWGFPEVWVEVPEVGSPSRPRVLRPGLRIQVLEDGRYRESAESRAFPGWRGEEIHRALNETVTSEATEAVLWRVGRTLGDREGTVPEDDPLLRRMERRGRARAMLEERGGMAAAILRQRGIEVSPGFPASLSPEVRAALASVSPDDVVEAASRAATEADFFRRLAD